jgi:hypothetical protein
MNDYQSNSHRSKEGPGTPPPEKKVEKIITGSARAKKKSEIGKFSDTFISGDIGSVKSYILADVLIPAIRKAIWDIVTSGLDMVLFEGKGHAKKNTASSRVSYQGYFDRETDRRDYRKPGSRTGYSYDDIILETRGEAEDVLSRMEELVSAYGLVSVADLYDLVGFSGNYTDNRYGWADVGAASVVRVRDGYMIKLPRALPLN